MSVVPIRKKRLDTANPIRVPGVQRPGLHSDA